MRTQELSMILEAIKSGNPRNLYINNGGLAQLGELLFYPKKGREELQKELLLILKNSFPKTYGTFLESLKKYHLTSYYTPKSIIEYKISLLKSAGFDPKTILEPSAGNGAYVQILKQAFPKASIVALEPDLLSYEILKNNNLQSENVTVLNTTFEAYYLEHQNKTFYDLVISNIPFGDIPIENAFEHNYIIDPVLKNVGNYFNAFAPEMCSIGGVTALLISSAFNEKSIYNGLRESILMKNDLILANRFNNMLFKQERTKVVSDLMLYQRKRDKSELTTNERLFADTISIDLGQVPYTSNAFFNQFPGQVNGEVVRGYFHGRPNLTVQPNEEQLTKFLERQLYSFEYDLHNALPNTSVSNTLKTKTTNTNQDVAKTPETSQSNVTQISNKQEIIKLGDAYVKNYTRLFFGSYNFDTTGNLWYYQDTYTKTKVPHKVQELVSDYVRLRNNLVLLQLNLEKGLLNELNLQKTFQEVDYQLDLFHFKWTSLDAHRVFLKEDFYFSRIRTSTESRIEGKGYGKNPNFTFANFLKVLPEQTSNTTVSLKKEPEVSSIEVLQHSTPLDYVKTQFDQTGKIDIKKVALAFKKTEKELLLEGLSKKNFSVQPYNNGAEIKYEVVPYFIFASGLIENKIILIQKSSPPYGLDSNVLIEALNKVKPAQLPLEAIEFNFESHFIPIHAKEAFLRQLINETVKINIGQFSSTLTLLFSQDYNQEAHERFSVVLDKEVRAGYKRILQSFSENKYPIIFSSFKDAQGKTIKKLDKDATLMAQNIYEELQLHFKSFIESDEHLKLEIEQNYYKAFLADVNLQVPKDWLRFPNTLVHEPYQHQIDSVLFGLSRGSALNDHQVGKGKTLSMALLAYKLKQQGKSRRTILLTLKSVAPQLEREIKSNFPQLNILRLDSKNMAKSKRARTLGSLAANKRIDLVIAEHGHLKQIPKQREFVLDILESKIRMIDQDLQTAKDFGNLKESKKLIKGLIKRKSNLEEKLKHTLKTLDEKKEGDTTFSDLQLDAILIDEAHYFKNIGFTTRHQNVSGLNNNADNLQNLDLEISIASIHHRVGADKNVFFYSGTPLKNSVTELYAYQRYLIPQELKRKQIHNFDAWASIFLKQSVSIEPNIFGDPRMHARFRYFINLPELSKMYNSFTHICRDKHFKTHNLKLDRDFVILESSPAYEDLKAASLDFTKNRNQKNLFTIPMYNEGQMKSAHITALNINRSLLIDPLSKENISISFSEKDQFKLRRIAKDIAELYHQTNPHKGVCLVFSDLNVWKPNQYNTYNTLAQFLMDEHQIPKTEIAFAQERKAKNATEKFQRDINDGTIRIAMGSTQVLGTGTNIQKRVVGIFHMDIPYSPDAFDQRAGRGLRKGNEIAKHYKNRVIERFYGIKDTTDIFSYSLNTHKEKFREQIREADPKQRVYDDLIPDDKNLSYAQMQAALIGDMEQFQLVKLSDDLKFLQAQKRLFELNKANSFKIIDRIKSENKEIKAQLFELENTKQSLGAAMVAELVSDSPFFEPLTIIEKLIHGTSLEMKLNAYDNVKQKIEHLNSSLVLKSKLNVNYSRRVLVTNLPSIQANLVFVADYVPSQKHYLFSYGLELKHGVIQGKRQQRFDPEKIHLQLLNLVKKMESEIRMKKFDLNHNLKSLETHQKKVTIEFPKEKQMKISILNEEIKTIQRRRAIG